MTIPPIAANLAELRPIWPTGLVHGIVDRVPTEPRDHTSNTKGYGTDSAVWNDPPTDIVGLAAAYYQHRTVEALSAALNSLNLTLDDYAGATGGDANNLARKIRGARPFSLKDLMHMALSVGADVLPAVTELHDLVPEAFRTRLSADPDQLALPEIEGAGINWQHVTRSLLQGLSNPTSAPFVNPDGLTLLLVSVLPDWVPVYAEEGTRPGLARLTLGIDPSTAVSVVALPTRPASRALADNYSELLAAAVIDVAGTRDPERVVLAVAPPGVLQAVTPLVERSDRDEWRLRPQAADAVSPGLATLDYDGRVLVSATDAHWELELHEVDKPVGSPDTIGT